MTRANIPGAKKAAIVLLTMGEELASNVLKHMDQEEIHTISACSRELSKLPYEVFKQVVEEFLQRASSEEILPYSGENYFRKLLVKAIGEKRAETLLGKVSGGQEKLQILRRIDPKVLANFLRNEHPQTAALIVAHLDPEQSILVLGELPETMHAEIIMRIAKLDSVAPEVINEIEEVLENEIKDRGADAGKKVGGLKPAAEIVNHMDKTWESSIMARIEEESPDLAEEIRKLMFIFDDLVAVDDRGIQAVLKEVASNELALALKTASGEVQNLIFKNMSQRGAEMLKEDMEAMGPVRLSDVEKAQQSVIKTARRLEAEGKIIIRRGGADDVLV